jgi:hypothetical protein
MLHNRSARIIKKLCTKWQKEPGKTTEGISGFVRLEPVNKWPTSMMAMMMMMIVVLQQ